MRFSDFKQINGLLDKNYKKHKLFPLFLWFTKLFPIKISYGFVVEKDKKIIGFAATYKKFRKNGWFIFSVVVKKQFRERGIGTKLMRHLLNNIKRKGRKAFLIAENGSEDFYKKLGFRKNTKYLELSLNGYLPHYKRN
jgi:N-acetylglutamate synthase-like GNAT family acetyltransferase